MTLLPTKVQVLLHLSTKQCWVYKCIWISMLEIEVYVLVLLFSHKNSNIRGDNTILPSNSNWHLWNWLKYIIHYQICLEYDSPPYGTVPFFCDYFLKWFPTFHTTASYDPFHTRITVFHWTASWQCFLIPVNIRINVRISPVLRAIYHNDEWCWSPIVIYIHEFWLY